MSDNPGKLRKNILSAAGQTIVQTVALVCLYRILIDSMGVEKLGIWSIILASAAAARFSELGLGGTVVKFVARYRAEGDTAAVAESLQTAAITIAVSFGTILLIAYPILFNVLKEVLPERAVPEGRSVLPYALLSLWLTALGGVCMSGLDACMRSDLRAALMITASLLFVALAWMLVLEFGLVGLAVAQVIQSATLACLGWLVLRRVVGALPWAPMRWSLRRLRSMFVYGVNFQVNSIVMLLFEPTTKILLGRYGELAAAGYFELGQRLVMKVRALIVESNRVIVAVFAGIPDGVQANSLYTRNVRWLFFLLTPLFAALIGLMPLISELWIGVFVPEFVTIAVALAGAWYTNSLSAPAYFAFLGLGTLRWVTVSHLVMGIANLVLGLTLGYWFGWGGVIAGFVISLVMGSLITVCAYRFRQSGMSMSGLTMMDLKLAVASLGAAALSLITYSQLVNLEVGIWLRCLVSVSAIALVTLLGAWRHPVGLELLTAIRSWFAARPKAHPSR